MDWLTGSKHGEAKRLIRLLADSSQRDRAAQDLIRLGADAVPALIDSLQTQDPNLLPVYQHILARIHSASPALLKALSTAHPIIRGRAAEVFAISRDKNAVPALLEALKGEYYTVRSRAALALGRIGD
ncbi:MAG TPA: HEAT repeat domain-containing protein, partial [Anaerolineales bacterium]|nr:HEAT repeat domain-containing protein [Anaerolineales bacterium]